jgi:hypothetical protein
MLKKQSSYIDRRINKYNIETTLAKTGHNVAFISPKRIAPKLV